MAKMIKCAWCQMMFEKGTEACPYCHKKMIVLPDGTLSAEGMKPCPFCRKPNKPDASRCSTCRKVIDGSDVRLANSPRGVKSLKIIGKIYIGVCLLVIPSFFMGMGWFMAIFFVGVAASVISGTIRGSKTLKEASDSTFMLYLVFILIGGFLTVSMWRIGSEARAAKVDHFTPDQFLIFTACVLLTGVAGVFWASRQGIPNIWKYIKDLYTN